MYWVFVQVHHSYSEGRLPYVRKNGGRPQADYEDMVLDEVENDAGTSVRAIEMNTGVLKSFAQRILKRHQYHPYHVCKTLLPQDYLPRMEFCRRKNVSQKSRSAIFGQNSLDGRNNLQERRVL
ncbi:hypothetical protein HHI36_014871 [Cryptolaemus montrouzieri]|uniref:Uncharacterized protein n=1 Tax=Cryptolaemus montrouzieri TaxID=559131 RepID=A0ABD2N4E6_9CUCU